VFASEETCHNYLESARWPDGVRCLKCDHDKVSKFTLRGKIKTYADGTAKTTPDRFLYQCLKCKYQFAATTGTIFSDTHLPLGKWMLATAIMCNAKKSVSAKQMERDMDVSYKTAWYLNHRIREGMGLVEAADGSQLTGVVEADETYIGGKYDARRKRARYGKEPVFGVVQRDGKARTYHLSGKPTLKGVVERIKDNVEITADAIYTDESNLYGTVAGCIKNHKHDTVCHIAKEWVRGDVHTGTIDGYWGLLKRGVIGSFHQVSIKHLQRYLNEFQFKWNHRRSGYIRPSDRSVSHRISASIQGAHRASGF
jgi:transposase-like protein